MRMDKESKKDAYYIVNRYKEEELADIIYRYGEERWSKRIAQFIVKERSEKPIKTTFELVNVIKKAIPKGARQDGPHPAKRTFQAIRIEVNDELNILENVVTQAVERLKSGGRIGVITFHSLEDRIVKQTLAQLAKGCICPPQLPVCVCGRKPLVKKVGNIVPSDAEIDGFATCFVDGTAYGIFQLFSFLRTGEVVGQCTGNRTYSQSNPEIRIFTFHNQVSF